MLVQLLAGQEAELSCSNYCRLKTNVKVSSNEFDGCPQNPSLRRAGLFQPKFSRMPSKELTIDQLRLEHLYRQCLGISLQSLILFGKHVLWIDPFPFPTIPDLLF